MADVSPVVIPPLTEADLAGGQASGRRYLAGRRWAYTEAKTDVILGILEDAERWARGTGWTLPPLSAQGEGVAGAAAEFDPD